MSSASSGPTMETQAWWTTSRIVSHTSSKEARGDSVADQGARSVVFKSSPDGCQSGNGKPPERGGTPSAQTSVPGHGRASAQSDEAYGVLTDGPMASRLTHRTGSTGPRPDTITLGTYTLCHIGL